MIVKKMWLLFISICLSLIPVSSYAKNFTSAKIISSAHSRSCLNYRILPNPCIYMYLSCSLFGGCGIKFTARDRIRHKLPDLVVSAFRKPGDNPWTEIRTTESKIAKKVMDTTLTTFFKGNKFDGAEHENALVSRGAIQSTNNLRFNEANVIGSPAAKIVRNTLKYTVPSLMGGPFLCKSTSRAFFPYFMSEIDAVAWRKAELNLADVAKMTPLSREIGSLSGSNLTGNTWGAVIPRVGFVHQTEPVRAAAVIAQRAIDIVTQPYQFPHVYTPYGYNGYRTMPSDSFDCEEGFGAWKRDQYCIQSLSSHPDFDEMTAAEKQQLEKDQCPIQCLAATSFVQKMGPANEHTPAWQMITPKKSSSCSAFGSSNPKWGLNKNAEDGDYAWNYWRQYECCKPGPGILLNP